MANGISRPRYESGNLLGSEDLQTDQRYRYSRVRRHNRYLHGWGVLGGLIVAPANDPARPWALLVCPGCAIGPCGDDIEVTQVTSIDIRDYLWIRTPQEQERGIAYVGIRYDAQHVEPVAMHQASCGCGDPEYVRSRIRDDFELSVLFSPSESDARHDLCALEIALCPDSPASPYVLLARIILPESIGDPIPAVAIDNRIRRTL